MFYIRIEREQNIYYYAYFSTGKIIKIDVDTICLHGDNKNSVLLAKKLKEELINLKNLLIKMNFGIKIFILKNVN